MPATKTNYIVLYMNDSQVYAAQKKDVALNSPPPEGSKLEDKRVFFLAFEPDNQVLSVYQVPQEEVLNAEIKYKEPKVKEVSVE